MIIKSEYLLSKGKTSSWFHIFKFFISKLEIFNWILDIEQFGQYHFSRKYVLTCLLFLLTGLPLIAQQPVVAVHFESINKTRSAHLERFIKTTVGAAYDSLKMEKDAQALRNLQLFWQVEARAEDSDGGKIVIFDCREFISLLPIVNFGGVTNNFWFQAGGVERNWMGRGYTLGGYYRYYDRHSFEIFYQLPHVFGKRWGISGNAANYATIEPAYFGPDVAIYDVDHRAFTLTPQYALSPQNILAAGGAYLYERYVKNPDENAPNTPGPDWEAFDKYLGKVALMNNYIDYFFHYVKGFSNEIGIETVKTAGESDLFWKVLNISKLFIRHGSRGNWAFRFRAGISTNRESPFVPFLLDSYITVRGSGNRVARGTAEFTLNSEYRHTLMNDREFGAIQGVLFSDISAWRPAGGTLGESFNERNNVTFFGGGLRFYIKKLNHAIFRVDYGFSATEDKGRGFVVGLGQYF